ncbi:hypothetical protein GWO43_05865 [candidate division KSB1 bacterium]|nr:hypothetical protein [candidate division KSB1 bacterium]NIW68476.1 hypothetical protein [candidate division KSB1 bacterium]NIX70095.1 hypothetical protein [candidate division KSB1 bacterium]
MNVGAGKLSEIGSETSQRTGLARPIAQQLKGMAPVGYGLAQWWNQHISFLIWSTALTTGIYVPIDCALQRAPNVAL